MDAVERFQALLEKLFQFDASDLDFGIFRILNFKRNQIRKFIHEDLKDTVEKVFAVHKDERLDNIGLQLEDAKQKVIQTLGTAAILATGELKDDFKGTPVGRDYLAIKAQKCILSKTSYEDLIKGIEEPDSREEYEANHVLFLDDQEWPKKFFREILR